MTTPDVEALRKLGPAKTLLYAVADELNLRYPVALIGVEDFPEGLRLELHPRAHNLLRQDPDTFMWGPSLDNAFPVPVKVTTDIPPGTWRLVIVTEDVLLGGQVAL